MTPPILDSQKPSARQVVLPAEEALGLGRVEEAVAAAHVALDLDVREKPLGDLYKAVHDNLLPAFASLGEQLGLVFTQANGKPIFGSMTDDIKNLLISVKELIES